MKIFKTLLLASAFVASALIADAGQPTVWTATITNNIPTAAYGGGSTNPMNGLIWTSDKGQLATNSLDLLQSTSFSVWVSVNPTATAVAANNGTVTVNSTVSPDLVIQAAGPAAIASVTTTNLAQGGYTNVAIAGFRYYTPTTLASTVTNSYTTNSLIQFKVFLSR